MTFKKTIQKTTRWLAAGSAICLILSAMMFGLAQTDWGKGFIAGQLEKALNDEGDTRVEIGKIEGVIPFRIRLNHLALRDSGLQWLKLEEVQLRWSLVRLLRGHFFIEELSVGMAQISRPPEAKKAAETAPNAMPTWLKVIDRFRLEHFSVEQLVLEESLFGERAIFRAEASLGASLSGRNWESWLNLERTDHSDVPTRFNATFKGVNTELKVDVRLEDPPGGLAAKALGVEGPIFFTLKGEGPMMGWRGDMRVEVGQVGELQADVILDIREDVGLTTKGDVRLAAGIVPVSLRGLMDTESHIQFGARLSKKRILTINQLGLTSGKMSFEMSGSMDLKNETSRGRFELRCEDLGPLEALANINGKGGLTVEGQFSGPLRQPEAGLVFRLGEVSAGDFHVQHVDGNLQLGLLKPLGSRPLGVRLRGHGRSMNLVMKKAGRLPEKDLNWAIALEGPVGERFLAEKIELVGTTMSAKFSGWINADGTRATMDALIKVADLSPFSDLLEMQIDGNAHLKAMVVANPKDLSLTAQFSGKYTPPEAAAPSLASLIGRELSYEGNLSFDGKSVVKAPDFRIEALAGTLTGAVAYNLSKRNLEGAYQLEVPKLTLLSSLLKQDIRGALSSGGTFSHNPEGMTLAVQTAGRHINLKGKKFEHINATLNAAGLPPKSSGRLFLEGRQTGNKFQGVTHFDLDGRRLALSRLSLQAADAEVTGNLTLDLAHFLAEGELTGKSTDLRAISTLIDQKIEGSATIHARLSSSKRGQQFVFDMDAFNLINPLGRIEKAHLQGELLDLLETPRGNLKLNLKGGTMKDLLIASMEIGVNGDFRKLHFTAKGKGHYSKESFDMDTSGLFAYLSDGQKIMVNRFQGHYGKQPLALERPITLKRSVRGLSFEPFAIKVAGGRLEGSGKIEKNSLNISFRVSDISLAELPMTRFPNFRGKAKGDIKISGSPGQPDVRARVRISDLGLRDSQIKDLPPGTLVANAGLRQGMLTAEMTLEGFTAKPFKAGLTLPMALALYPISLSIPGSGELRGDFHGEVNLARIGEVMALHDQKLDGRLELALKLKGQVDAPEITGGGRIQKGAYENLRIGTILKEIDVDLVSENEKLSIKTARFSDGETGEIMAQGWLKMLPKKGFPFLITLKLDKAKPVRHDSGTVTMDGTLKLSGSLRDLLLEGHLQIVDGEFRIPERLPPEIVQLDVEETPGPGAEVVERKETSLKAAPPRSQHLKLDISIESSGRIFLTGRGLTSEWKGNLLVKGSADAPVVTGSLSVVRGHADFLGKRFDLDRGVIAFGGAVPPSPQLDVLAEARAKNITARLEIAGPIKNPNIKLSSDPALPSDEILARLLFGRSLTEITPFQAVQLALAANTLAGGGGFDLMGRTRKILRVDQLDVKNLDDGTDEATVSAGKYLTEDVYLEVEKGLGPKSGKASVEWEATPNIGIETEVGENADAGMGINWKWHY